MRIFFLLSFLPRPSVLQLAGQASSTTLHIKTEELSRQYKDQLKAMREEKDQEIQRLRVRVETRLLDGLQ